MIRKAEQKDIPRLLDLLFQVNNVHACGRPDIFKINGTKYTAPELEELIKDEKYPIFVFDDGGTVRGYAFCKIVFTEDGTSLRERITMYVDDICVDADSRGRHIGTALYRYVENTAREAGCDSITLNVWELNGPARAFYDSLGMKPLKTTMEKIL